ncbi:GNAT family N-acetyltransferase [Ornithinibacillus xuwenensis]|uniref:GNAT family protein n=1 Tax=Ornithinibacillus xuwenensis TaxID=3144668 RepID=A0ABU9XEX9_9BACI
MFSLEIDEDLTLRLLHQGDAKDLFDLTDRSREHLREWLPWLDQTKTERDSKNFIQSAEQGFIDRNGLTLGIYYHQKLAGVIGFNSFDWTNRIGIIGYWLGEDFIGNGIMTRAAAAITEYGFHQLELNRIEIRAAVENTKSRAIPERLGYTKEGQIRHGEWLYNHYVDLVIYGMLAYEWELERS